ncbi:MAG TPA: hypothetical protein VFY12_10450 [Arenimonas sp.]|nr:hypothetical protein [Arenimonas sp.]
MRLSVLLLLLACLMLSGCPKAETGSENISSDATTATAAPDKEMFSDPISATPGEVDYSCKTDADCEIKNVGNCCGYYPACVNTDSPTFPEQIKAKCETEGTMSVCGFPELKGCQCVDNRCEGIRGEANALPVQ